MKPYIALVGVLAVAACSEGVDPVTASFTSEAGSILDTGNFGNATMNNTLVQTGQREYVIDLNQRFASEVENTVNFAFDSAVLDAQAQAILREQASWIRQFPEVRFRVYGHTDLVGSEAYNFQLGKRRAEAVVRFLVGQGISASRLEALTSKGQTQPLVATPLPERQNRRAVTEVSGFVESHPLVLNGKYAQVVFREYVASATQRQRIEGTTITQQ